MSKSNILFIFERNIIPTNGGVERVTFLLAEEMNIRGHNVEFLSVGPEDWSVSESSENVGFKQHYICSSSQDFKTSFCKLLKDSDINKIILQGTHSYVTSVLDCIPEGIERYLVFHYQPFPLYGKERIVKKLTPWNSEPIKGKILKIISLLYPYGVRRYLKTRAQRNLNYIIPRVTKYIFLSPHFIKRACILFQKLDKRKFAAINNPNTFLIEDNGEIDKKDNIVVFVGRLTNPQKNVTGFVDAWKLFSASHPDWEAKIVGDGEHRKYIENYARKKGVMKLSFEGNCKNVSDYYKKSKILCLTSTFEGWGMVLPEAMAFGCVPVAFNSYESIEDIVKHGENGLLVAPFDAKEMAASISKLADNEEMRLKLSYAGQSYIKKFAVDKIVDDWEKIWDEQKALNGY